MRPVHATFNLDLPGRTSADVIVRADRAMRAAQVGVDNYNMEPDEVVVRSMACMDCPFVTADLAAMRDHQRNQAKHHSWLQRWRRRGAMRRVTHSIEVGINSLPANATGTIEVQQVDPRV